jgi:valyl-tRNA synthetase
LNEVNFYPDTSRKILTDWIDKISIDWPISRRRFYATEFLFGYSEKEGKKLVALPVKKKYYQAWKENVPADSESFF